MAKTNKKEKNTKKTVSKKLADKTKADNKTNNPFIFIHLN